MKKFYISFLLMLPLLVFSQGENNHWYFWYGAAVNFNNPVTPQVLTDSQMTPAGFPASVSDSSGKLLFYTNGETVLTREHQTMQNGLLQTGWSMKTQIVQHPSNKNLYYIFVLKSIGSGSTANPKVLMYSLVDMSQGPIGNDGTTLGLVLTHYKNITLYNQYQSPNIFPSFTIVKHNNGNSFWIVTHNSNKIYSFLVNNLGQIGNAVQSNLNVTIPTVGYSTGMRVSPEISSSNFSNYLFISMTEGGSNDFSKILSFNNLTGQVTNNYDLTISSIYPTTIEFNKDSSLMYIGRNGDSKIFVVDMINSVSIPVYHQIYNNTNPSIECSGIKRNRYDDIYISFRGRGYLSKILNPDSYSTSAVNFDNLYLLGRTSEILPEFVHTFFSLPCESDIVLSIAESNINYTHQAINNIVTQTNYKTNNTNGEIVMKAGNSIRLLPNTFIEQGSNFLATIEGCRADETLSKRNTNAMQNISLKIDLDSDIDNNVELYPNPASDFVNINSKLKIKSWEIYDMSGKQILKGNSNKIDVANFIKGVYMINIMFENGKNVSKKISIK